jgi:HK97 family phage portal protein
MANRLTQFIKSLGYKLGTPHSGAFNELVDMQLPPGWGYQNYLKAFGEVGWLFACVNVISNAVARQPWHLYELDSNGERTEVEKHDLIELWENPNRFQSRYQFIYQGTMYKKLVGEEFYQYNFNGKGQPAEAWLAPPAYMSVIPSPDKYIDHYEYRRNNQVTKFSVDEIIHIMTPNPFNPYRGLSEAQSLTSVIDSERYAASFQNKLFFNDARPGFVIEYPAQDLPNSESRKELVQEWDERYKGYRNAGKTAFLWGGKANTLTLSPRDLDFATLRNYSRDSILGAYGVPKSVLGMTEASTFASAKAGNYSFAFYVIHPELCVIREAINKELVPYFGDNLYYDFENPIPEDETMTVNNAVNLFKGGLIRRNEGRIMVDLEPVDTPDGDEFFTQPAPTFGGQPGSNNPADNSPENENAPDADKKDVKKKTYSEAESEAYWKGFVTTAETYEKQLITALQDIFAVTKDQILTKIKEGEHNALIDKVAIRDGYTQKATPILTNCMQAAVKAGKQLVTPENPHKDAPVIAPVLNAQASAWLQRRIAWAAQEIGETLSRDLAQSLAEGFTAGEGIPDLTDRVMQFFGDAVRSERIARTETISASAQGTLTGYQESGVVKKVQFYTAMDERTCEYCNEFHNKIYDIGQEMPIPLHPNCRCVWLPVIEG